MLSVTLRGQPATYTTEDGWRSNCGMTERFLREHLAGHEPNDYAAFAAVESEYGTGCALVHLEPKPDAVEPVAEAPKPEKRSKSS